ncbi:MAG: ribosome maturation factor RimM [Lautropia sp.]
MRDGTTPDASPATGEAKAAALDVDAWVDVGRIVGAFGVNGALKVEPFVEPSASVLLTARRWRLHKRGGEDAREVDVVSVKQQFDSLVATLDLGFTREDAMQLKGRMISVRRGDFPTPAEGEYYWSDLVGCSVHNQAGRLLGVVSSIDEHGADPILNLGNRFLIPFIDAYVLEISLDRRDIRVDWSEDWS